MSELLTIIGIFMIGMALRSCHSYWLRKLGAVTYLAASGLAAYFLSDNIWIALAAVLLWFFLPWIELLTRVRRLRLPLNNRLRRRRPPHPEHFPEAAETAAQLESAGFEFVEDVGWDWGSSNIDYQLYWHPEERTVAAICLFEQSNITFSFVSLTSYDELGLLYRSSNYPFSTTLKLSPQMLCNQLSCRASSIELMLTHHHAFIAENGPLLEDLMIPDPDKIVHQIEEETRKQIDHNLAAGIIIFYGNGELRYTFRGLCFLWRQILRDLIRLC